MKTSDLVKMVLAENAKISKRSETTKKAQKKGLDSGEVLQAAALLKRVNGAISQINKPTVSGAKRRKASSPAPLQAKKAAKKRRSKKA